MTNLTPFCRSSDATLSNSLDRSKQNWTTLNHEEITTNLQLVRIDVSDNNITEFDSTIFTDHRLLEVLTLSGNQLFDFPINTSFLISTTLERIYLSSCGITTVYNATFSELPKLKELDLSSNRLAVIESAAFSTQIFLRILNFDFNNLTSLPVDILKRSKMNATVSLNYNAGFNFPSNEVLMKSKALKEFQCNHCGITGIYEETLSELPSLESIHLNNNNITTINSKIFAKNRDIISLSIEQNRLDDFPMSVFDVIPKLKSLCVDGNPFLKNAKNAFRNYYKKVKLRSNCSSSGNVDENFENKSNANEPTKNKGISDAFIASYLVIVVVAQAAVIAGLVVYYFKIVFTDKCDEFDYSSNVLNDHDVYDVS